MHERGKKLPQDHFQLTTLEISQAMLVFLGIADAAGALTTRT
jgi:hypothetical protein